MRVSRNTQQMTAILLLAVGGLCLYPVVSQARLTPVGPVVQVNTELVPGSPDVLGLADGGFVVVFDGVGEVRYGHPAFVRRFGAEGEATGPAVPLDGIQGIHRIVALGDQIVTIAPDLENRDLLLLRKFSADGVPDNSIVPIDSTWIGAESFDLTLTPEEEVLVVWEEGIQLFARRFDAALSPLGNAFTVGAYSDFGAGFHIGATPEGGLLLAFWLEGLGDVRVRRIDSNDQRIGSDLVVADAIGNADAPHVCIDASGDFVVGWNGAPRHGEFRRYDVDAHPLTDRIATGLQSSALACLPQRQFVIAGVDGYRSSIGAEALDSRTRLVGELRTPVNDFSWRPEVAALPGGNVVLAWSSCANFFNDCDIYVQRMSVDDSLVCPGDCDGDGAVTIDELVRAINYALIADDPKGACVEIRKCSAIDTNLDCIITVPELVAAVNRALQGCMVVCGVGPRQHLEVVEVAPSKAPQFDA